MEILYRKGIMFSPAGPSFCREYVLFKEIKILLLVRCRGSYAIFPKYNQVTDIQYTITGNAIVSVVIKDSTGNSTIKTLVNNLVQNAGTYKIQWDGKDTNGNVPYNSGSYRIQVTAVDAISGTTVTGYGNISILK